jgi:hypothetical protein
LALHAALRAQVSKADEIHIDSNNIILKRARDGRHV